ncbi:hypothetical protein lerEdw1_001981 [Lerista edwardsae]|nr:hypothetical protein lerEdw1_001981 [Lerista edwardsae]
MKTLCAFLLVGLLVLMSEMPSASAQGDPKVKPGSCPTVVGRCRMINPPNRCTYDSECEGQMKCCETICGRDCANPEMNSSSQRDILHQQRYPPYHVHPFRANPMIQSHQSTYLQQKDSLIWTFR